MGESDSSDSEAYRKKLAKHTRLAHVHAAKANAAILQLNTKKEKKKKKAEKAAKKEKEKNNENHGGPKDGDPEGGGSGGTENIAKVGITA